MSYFDTVLCLVRNITGSCETKNSVAIGIKVDFAGKTWNGPSSFWKCSFTSCHHNGFRPMDWPRALNFDRQKLFQTANAAELPLKECLRSNCRLNVFVWHCPTFEALCSSRLRHGRGQVVQPRCSLLCHSRQKHNKIMKTVVFKTSMDF